MKKSKLPTSMHDWVKLLAKMVGAGILAWLFFRFESTQILGIISVMCIIAFSIGRFAYVLQSANIGLSFNKLMVMLLMYWYGIPVAIVAALFIQLAEYTGQNFWKVTIVFQIPNIMLMPLYGFWILNYSITWAGMFLLIIAEAVQWFTSIFFLGKNPMTITMFHFTLILFNFPFFWRIAPLLI